MTEEEREKFLEEMHEQGKDWDAEKKEVVVWVWQPEMNSSYWALDYDSEMGKFSVETSYWYDDEIDNRRLERGWVAHLNDESKERLQKIADKLNDAIKNIR